MKKKKIFILCLAAVGIVLIAGAAFAAVNTSSFLVDWWVFSGGGAPSSAGDYAMNGSLGQSVIGSSSSTNFSIDHGYWLKGTYDIYLPLVMR